MYSHLALRHGKLHHLHHVQDGTKGGNSIVRPATGEVRGEISIIRKLWRITNYYIYFSELISNIIHNQVLKQQYKIFIQVGYVSINQEKEAKNDWCTYHGFWSMIIARILTILYKIGLNIHVKGKAILFMKYTIQTQKECKKIIRVYRLLTKANIKQMGTTY